MSHANHAGQQGLFPVSSTVLLNNAASLANDGCDRAGCAFTDDLLISFLVVASDYSKVAWLQAGQSLSISGFLSPRQRSDDHLEPANWRQKRPRLASHLAFNQFNSRGCPRSSESQPYHQPIAHKLDHKLDLHKEVKANLAGTS
jgi:hypothetical protein